MKECFICRAIAAPETEDTENLVLLRAKGSIIMLNRYPYTVGALLVAPNVHRPSLHEIEEENLLEVMRLVKQGTRILDRAIQPKGYNIGINQGMVAGAGLEEHMHVHVVPRWGADTNFMTTIGEARVLSEALPHMYDRLKVAMERL